MSSDGPALPSSILFFILDYPDYPVSVDRSSLRNTPHFHDVFDSVVTKSETKQAMPDIVILRII